MTFWNIKIVQNVYCDGGDVVSDAIIASFVLRDGIADLGNRSWRASSDCLVFCLLLSACVPNIEKGTRLGPGAHDQPPPVCIYYYY